MLGVLVTHDRHVWSVARRRGSGRVLAGGGHGDDEGGDVRWGQGVAVQRALHVRATFATHEIELLGRLAAFGDDSHPQAVAEADHGPHDRRRIRISIIADE